jgi:hypothetical protein
MERTATEELRALDLLPSSPQAIRIDRFVEKRFGNSCVRYEPLEGGVLGYTQFGRQGVEAIVVSRALSEEGSRVAERRINTTLGHEAGHGLLHTHLFALDSFPIALFENASEVTPTRILCREEVPTAERQRRYDGRWWEFQANRMMGALLLPRPLVHACLRSLLAQPGALGAEVLPDGARSAAARLLSDVFDVNPIVAQIRVQTLYPPLDSSQLTF